MARPRKKPDIVGPMEIAVLLGVPRQTVDSWRWKGRMPPPDFEVSNRPLWLKGTIVKWDKDGRGRKPRASKEAVK